MTDFLKNYNFTKSEKKWQQFWQDSAIYAWDHNLSREQTYVIDTPPPTVSGELHIGHIYSYTHTDFIARYKRMKGFNIFYPMGFDDNGLPTERLIEKKKKIRANKENSKEFIKVCKEVIIDEEKKFQSLFSHIALSVDWNLSYQTISPISCKIAQMSFLDLIQKGHIYRESQPIIWDPVDRTALSQADIEEHEQTTIMNYIQFTTIEDGKNIVIATTRPELLPACVAIFFHPEDERYQHLLGKIALSPLFNVKIPIMSDTAVSPKKGTGLVMCCTFGDQVDVFWWKKYKLPLKIIITEYGSIDNIDYDHTCININKAKFFTSKFIGLKVIKAREVIISLLKNENLLSTQIEKKQIVKRAERSGALLEILVIPQWFIKTIEHKKYLLQQSEKINWYPKSMKIKLDQWINNLEFDWCISRQRYFGVSFPVWYSNRVGEKGKVILPNITQLPVNSLTDLPNGYSRDEVIVDYDVMDTWFTSSLSPQINSHGVTDDFVINKDRYKKLFPADLRPQAHEIIRTWAFYTILKSYLHTNTLPWSNIMISGWCLAKDKKKMSKSKGNIISLEQLLNNWGADLVRYWAANTKLGVDTVYSEEVFQKGKRLVNKLYNAAKFVKHHINNVSDINKKQISFLEVKDRISCIFDQYLINKIVDLILVVEDNLDQYQYSNAVAYVEEFFWKLFCDNYLEIIKNRVYNTSSDQQVTRLSAQYVLYFSFQVLLTLFAPFIPYITEEIFQSIYCAKSIHRRSNWPITKGWYFNDLSVDGPKKALIILELVRKIKARNKYSIKRVISCIEIKGVSFLTEDLISDLKSVTSSKSIKFVKEFSSTCQHLVYEDVEINVIY